MEGRRAHVDSGVTLHTLVRLDAFGRIYEYVLRLRVCPFSYYADVFYVAEDKASIL